VAIEKVTRDKSPIDDDLPKHQKRSVKKTVAIECRYVGPLPNDALRSFFVEAKNWRVLKNYPTKKSAETALSKYQSRKSHPYFGKYEYRIKASTGGKNE